MEIKDSKSLTRKDLRTKQHKEKLLLLLLPLKDVLSSRTDGQIRKKRHKKGKNKGWNGKQS